MNEELEIDMLGRIENRRVKEQIGASLINQSIAVTEDTGRGWIWISGRENILCKSAAASAKFMNRGCA